MGKSWFTIENKSTAAAAEVSIYDEIGIWGVTAKDFQSLLKDVPKGRQINLRVNSPGGSVFDGAAIYNMIAARREDVTAFVDGLAASMASVIVMAAGKVVMAENSMMMIHDPIGAAYGGSEDLRKMADVLDKIGVTISGAYEKKTGKTSEEVLAAMADETWFTAKEAKAFGLVDEISGAMQVAAKFDLQRFRRVPEGIAAKAEGKTPNAPTTPQNPQEAPMFETLLKALVEAKLIPSAKLDDKEATVAFEAAFKKLQEAQAADKSTITSLSETIQANLKTVAESFVADAVKEGKIKDDPALRAVWVKAYLSDEETAKAQLSSVSAVPTNTASNGKKTGPAIPTATQKIDDDKKIDPTLTGRSRFCASVDQQLKRLNSGAN